MKRREVDFKKVPQIAKPAPQAACNASVTNSSALLSTGSRVFGKHFIHDERFRFLPIRPAKPLVLMLTSNGFRSTRAY